MGSTCAWNTGTGLGGCDCPDKCSDDDQREDSMREQFIEACPRNDDGWEFPGPCADSFGEDWECGFLNYGETFGSRISQFTESGVSWFSPEGGVKTFDGENITDFEIAAKECYDLAIYNGDQTYTFPEDKCIICYEEIPFNSTNSTNQTLGDDFF